MKTKLRFLILAVALCVAAPVAILETGCPATTTQVTLAPGGSYTDPVLFQIDQATVIADSSLTAFVSWQKANATFLAQWPEVATLAATIQAKQDGWMRDVTAARDAYIVASKAYKSAVAAASAVSGPLPSGGGVTVSIGPDNTPVLSARAKFDGALAVVTAVLTQAAAFQSAHVK
jgi:hypothetical protein